MPAKDAAARAASTAVVIFFMISSLQYAPHVETLMESAASCVPRAPVRAKNQRLGGGRENKRRRWATESVIAVFLHAAAHLAGGILDRVLGDFLRRGLEQVDLQLVGEADEVEEHVGHFVAHRGALVGWQAGGLLVGQPLEVLEQLGGLDAERGDEVLRRVELVPVPLGGALAQLVAQIGPLKLLKTKP